MNVRMARQQILTGAKPPELRAIVHESVLRHVVGDYALMREQLGHMLDVGALKNVTLQVLPFTAVRTRRLEHSPCSVSLSRKTPMWCIEMA